MPSWFWIGIVFMVAVDAVVITWIVRRKMKASGLDFSGLRDLTKSVNERTGEYLRANWSGNTDELPAILRSLMPLVAEIARTHGQNLDDPTLEMLVKSTIASQRLATRAELDRAFDRIREQARSETAA